MTVVSRGLHDLANILIHVFFFSSFLLIVSMQFSGLYILAFTMIVVGFVLYYSMATYTQEPAPQETAIDGLDNPVSETEDDNRQETAIQFPSGEDAAETTRSQWPRQELKTDKQCKRYNGTANWNGRELVFMYSCAFHTHRRSKRFTKTEFRQ